MNERIQQLAEQARADVRATWAKENKIPYPEAHLAFQRDNDQKFAELLICDVLSQVEEIQRLDTVYKNKVGLDMEIDWQKEVLKNYGVE